MIIPVLLAVLLAGVAEAKELPQPIAQICDSQGNCVKDHGKQVVIEYDSFLKMVSMKEHSDKTRDKLAAENAVLVKLKDEQGSLIKVQADQIQACEAIVSQQEQLGATQEQLSQAVEGELKQQLAKEKRRSWYKSGTVWLGLVAAVGFWLW